MKNIIATFLIIASVFAFVRVANAAVLCTAVDSTNYVECCTGENSAVNETQCKKYEDSLGAATPTATTTTTPAATNSCGTINSQNFNSCCVGNSNTNGTIQSACTAYYSSGASTTTTTTAPTNTNSCSTLTAQNFNSCCIGNSNTNPALQASCTDYYRNGPTPVSGQAGGSPSVNPVNGGTNNNAYNTGSGAGIDAAGAEAARASAQCSSIKFKTLLDIAIWAKCIIGAIIIPGIFTLAFVVFLWGVFKFMRSSEQKDKQESKQFIYMGLIGLFVMVSVWGIIRIAQTTLGLDTAVPMLQTDYLSTSKASK